MKKADDRQTNRRGFFRSGTVAAMGLAAGVSSGNAPGALGAEAVRENVYREPARAIPIAGRADVVVCGAGPAGVAAAIAAARCGAKTRLIEVNGCLGGIWTAGLLSYIIDAGNKPGIMQEILQRLKDRRAGGPDRAIYEPEAMKIVLEEMCREAGVEIRLHTRCAATVRDEANRLALVLTESKSGREGIAGKVFVDTSGDGDLAAQAGCGWDYGRPDGDEAQPMSFIVLLTGIHLDEVKPFASGLPGESWAVPKRALAGEIERGCKVGPSYAYPTLFPVRPGLFALMANHEYGFKGFNADELTRATLQGRAEVHRMIDGLRSLGGVWKGIRICSSPERIGVRSGRRIHGRYTITADDLVRGARFDDAVCRCSFGVDVHSTSADRGKGIESAGVRAKPYDIPYRALVAKDVDGLLMAGRCISGDFFAHSSYRVTGNAVATGEAAGMAAAAAVRSQRMPHQIDWSQVRDAANAAGQEAKPAG